MTILWLDDMRNPYKYLSANKNTDTFLRNKKFYDDLMRKTDIDFVWVKNIEEFSNYILKNGLPEFVSFDHDLGKGLPKGLDCAKWLIDYCRKTNNRLPKFYVHSANPNGQREINAILNNALTESKANKMALIRLTEEDLHQIIKEAVNRCLAIME